MFGIYVHIPFCIRRCSYCDFNSNIYGASLASAYLDALLREIEMKSESNSRYIEGCTADTLYIGGGTPSLLSPGQLERFVSAVRSTFRLSEGCEITLEANPGTLNGGKLAAMREQGVNRLSIGLQTTDDERLKLLGRIHSYQDFVNSVEMARREGFENISADIIFGIPGERLEDFREDLDRVLALGLPHLSIYSLILEEGTPLWRMVSEGRACLPDEDACAEMFEHAMDRTAASGLHQYEVSNYSVPGMESRHNIMYWKNGQYLGLGAGAHSHIGMARFQNRNDINEYISDIKSGRDPVEEAIELCVDDEMDETIILGLRMMEGVSCEEFEERFGVSPLSAYGDTIRKMRISAF